MISYHYLVLVSLANYHIQYATATDSIDDVHPSSGLNGLSSIKKRHESMIPSHDSNPSRFKREDYRGFIPSYPSAGGYYERPSYIQPSYVAPNPAPKYYPPGPIPKTFSHHKAPQKYPAPVKKQTFPPRKLPKSKKVVNFNQPAAPFKKPAPVYRSHRPSKDRPIQHKKGGYIDDVVKPRTYPARRASGHDSFQRRVSVFGVRQDPGLCPSNLLTGRFCGPSDGLCAEGVCDMRRGLDDYGRCCRGITGGVGSFICPAERVLTGTVCGPVPYQTCPTTHFCAIIPGGVPYGVCCLTALGDNQFNPTQIHDCRNVTMAEALILTSAPPYPNTNYNPSSLTNNFNNFAPFPNFNNQQNANGNTFVNLPVPYGTSGYNNLFTYNYNQVFPTQSPPQVTQGQASISISNLYNANTGGSSNKLTSPFTSVIAAFLNQMGGQDPGGNGLPRACVCRTTASNSFQIMFAYFPNLPTSSQPITLACS